MKKTLILTLFSIFLIGSADAAVLTRQQKSILCNKLNNRMALYKDSKNALAAKLGSMSGETFKLFVCPVVLEEAAIAATQAISAVDFFNNIQGMLDDAERTCLELPRLIAKHAAGLTGKVSPKAKDFVNKILEPVVNAMEKLMTQEPVLDACFMAVDKKLHPDVYRDDLTSQQ